MVNIVFSDDVAAAKGARAISYLQSTDSFTNALQAVSNLGYHTVYIRENDLAGVPGYVTLSPNTDPVVYIDFDARYMAVGQGRFNTVEEIIFHEFAHIALGHLEGNTGFEGEAEAIAYTNNTFRDEVGLPHRQNHEIVTIRSGADYLSNQCFDAEVRIDMWPLEPDFAPDPNNPHKQYDQDEVRAKVWKKPIEQIRVGDLVVSFDDDGNLVPGPVTRTFQNSAKILLNFHGTRVTPGHVYYRPDSARRQKFETLIDVLRDDGVIQRQDGTVIRAATNVPVGDARDGFVRAITGARNLDGTFAQSDEGRIRLGTRFLVGDGNQRKSFSVAGLIEAGGGVVGDDELVYVGDGPGMPFYWEFSDTLPKPEDFVLACSDTTLEHIYKAAEWESQGPRLPAPVVLDRGPVQPLTGAALSAMPRNEPLHVDLPRSGDAARKADEELFTTIPKTQLS